MVPECQSSEPESGEVEQRGVERVDDNYVLCGSSCCLDVFEEDVVGHQTAWRHVSQLPLALGAGLVIGIVRGDRVEELHSVGGLVCVRADNSRIGEAEATIDP